MDNFLKSHCNPPGQVVHDEDAPLLLPEAPTDPSAPSEVCDENAPPLLPEAPADPSAPTAVYEDVLPVLPGIPTDLSAPAAGELQAQPELLDHGAQPRLFKVATRKFSQKGSQVNFKPAMTSRGILARPPSASIGMLNI